MRRVADASRAHYRALVYEDPEFQRYFRDVTPIDVIERMQIGGRVAHRDGSGIEALRAVPWVYAWTQSRHSLPGWFGIGTGLDAAARELGADRLGESLGGLAILREPARMTSRWNWCARTSRSPRNTMAWRPDPCAGFVAAIAREHALAKRWITWIKGEVDLLDSRPQMQRSVLLRAPYLDPMHVMQVDLLRRWRAGDRADRELFDALLASVTGIALGAAGDGLGGDMGELLALTAPGRSACVYCASSRVCDPHYHDVARRLGVLLATRGMDRGLRRRALGLHGSARGGRARRGRARRRRHPEVHAGPRMGPRQLSELHVVEDMRTRKHEMLTRASAVIALAGGTGTLEELLEAMTLKRLGLFLGPIVIVNTRGYYAPLLAQLASAIDGRFMDSRHGAMWSVVAEPDDVLPAGRSRPRPNGARRIAISPWSADSDKIRA